MARQIQTLTGWNKNCSKAAEWARACCCCGIGFPFNWSNMCVCACSISFAKISYAFAIQSIGSNWQVREDGGNPYDATPCSVCDNVYLIFIEETDMRSYNQPSPSQPTAIPCSQQSVTSRNLHIIEYSGAAPRILRSIHKCVSCTYLPSYFDMQCQWHGRVEAGWGRAIWMHGYKILQMAIIQLFHSHNISDSASGWDISLVSILWLTFGWDENELQEKETWIR